MRRMRGSWFAAALVPAVFAGVVYLQAGAQTAPERQPLITEALVDAENGTLTINGFDFAGEVPTVTLGMSALPVLSVTESGVVTGLPEVLPGTYLLALSWADGAGAVFYPTLGAVGPAGPAGPPGEPVPILAMGSAAGGGEGAVDGGGASSPDHAGATNTHYGPGALAVVTTGRNNSAFGHQSLHNLSTGNDNAGFGRVTLRDLTTGSDNLALGTLSLFKTRDGSFNTGIGSRALEANLSGDGNVGHRRLGASVQRGRPEHRDRPPSAVEERWRIEQHRDRVPGWREQPDGQQQRVHRQPRGERRRRRHPHRDRGYPHQDVSGRRGRR